MSADRDRRAAIAVAARAQNATDCRLLLDMLGLQPEPREVPEEQQDGRQHGRDATYRQGCRCTACREANASRHRRWTQRAARNPEGADRAGHGKAGTYNNHGCRCDACTEAHMARINAYRARRAEVAA